MKTSVLFCGLLCLRAGGLALAADESVPSVQLKGIMDVAGKESALLQVNRRPRSDFPPMQINLTLQKGQQDAGVEVLVIDAPAGKVRILQDGQINELTFAPETTPGTLIQPSSGTATGENAEEVSTLRLQGMALSEVLHLYQTFVHRTLLRPWSLPVAFGPDLYTEGKVTSADVAKVIEESLLAKGVVLRADGEKFAVAAPNWLPDEQVTAQLKEAREVATTIEKRRKAAGNMSDIFVSGTINFPRTDLSQVLAIYAELTDRTIIRPAALPGPTVSFKNYTDLTHEECVFALTAVFSLNGISVVPAADKFLFVIPPVQKDIVAGLRSQKGPIDYLSLTNPVPPMTVNIPYGDLELFAKVYGQLAGRQVEIGSDAPRLALGLRTQTQMTAGEALHAIDWLFALHGLKVREEGTGLEIVSSRSGEK